MEKEIRQAQKQLFEISTLLERMHRLLKEYQFGAEHPVRPEIEELLLTVMTKKKPQAEACQTKIVN